MQTTGNLPQAIYAVLGTMAATLALPEAYTQTIATALGQKRKPVLVWLEFQDCAGNTESMLRTMHPTVEDVVLETLSWEYHETIMAGYGKHAEAALKRVVDQEKGKYLVVVEGRFRRPMTASIARSADGRHWTSLARFVEGGGGDRRGCLRLGRWPGPSNPNPTGAVGLHEAVPGINIVNLPGCPHNSVNTAAVLVHYLTFGELPALDPEGRPLFAYGQLIHDQCERRVHYDAGRYVQAWGDEGHRKGWCLFKMGCKGPEANYNCPTVRWNGATSWPVKSGHGCIACASSRFWDTKSPFYERLPHPAGFGVDVTAGQIGWTVVAGVAAATAAHAVGHVVRDHFHPDDEDSEAAADEKTEKTTTGVH